MAQTTPVMPSEDTRGTNEQQRHRGDAVTAESGTRACDGGETRRRMTRSVHGYEDGDVQRARNPQQGRQVRPLASGPPQEAVPREGGGRRSLGAQPHLLRFTQTVAASAFGSHGAVVFGTRHRQGRDIRSTARAQRGSSQG